MAQFSVLVSNLGTVCDTQSRAVAKREFALWKEHASAEHGRASGETVTLMEGGEPVKEFDPNAGFFFVEMTDTFGGEANYSWVHRFKVRANTATGAIRKVSAETGYAGRIRKDWDSGDTMQYKVQGACICFFVSYWDEHCNELSGIKTL